MSCTYTLSDVADKYNDILDVKAYAEVLRRSDFPTRLLPRQATALGTLLVDIGPDGAAVTCTIESAQLQAPREWAYPCAFMWLNLERPDHGSPVHSNVLVWHAGLVRRFEPHGADPSLPAHAACGFQGYYLAPLLDTAIEAALTSAGLIPAGPGGYRYAGPDITFPVLGQSLSLNSSPRNALPGTPGRAFKRVGATDGAGDNFCGAWTLLYLSRVLALDTGEPAAHAALLADMCGAEVHGGAASATVPRPPAADIISDFILRAHGVYADDARSMQVDAEWVTLAGGTG